MHRGYATVSSGVVFRPFEPADLAAVVAINAECVPEVGAADEARLGFIVDEAISADVAEVDGAVVGFLLGLGPGSTYDSVNYRWFADRHDRFAYVDRIAITAVHRGSGLGPAFYDRFETVGRADGAAVLCAEVNVEPPNPRSMRFHETFGFRAVAETAPTGSDDYRVAMVEKPLS